MEHWFWSIFCLVVILWYGAVTIIVGIRGGKDIQEMIAGLKEKRKQSEEKA